MTLFTRFDRHAGLVGQMTDTLQIDLVQAAQNGIIPVETPRSAVQRCTSCDNVEGCKAWLAEHETAPAAPSFCRNKPLFDALALPRGEAL